MAALCGGGSVVVVNLREATMASADVLIVHTSKHGQSQRIAQRIGGVVERAGLTCELADLRHQPDVTPHERRAVVVVASVHMDAHAEELISWLERHRAALAATELALLSVSLKAAAGGHDADQAVAGYLDALRTAAACPAPALCEALGGALQYREYSWPTRRMLRSIAKSAGLSTDTSRDHDYCDDERVDAIAQRVAGLAGAGLVVAAAD